ncbi:MAG: methylmalonyl-CoA mutase [Chlorobiaceae bacterium]|nr:methylmalonyl-CoA mutase [Chlorobiaceae bacterium]
MSQAEPLFSGFPPVNHDTWKSRVLQELKGADYSKIVWKTPEGFALAPWYNRSTSIASPAVPLNRLNNSWNICECIDASQPADAAAAISAAIIGGATAIELHFTDPLQANADTLRTMLGEVDLATIPIYLSGAFGDTSALLDTLMALDGFSANTGAILLDAAEANPAEAVRCPAGFRAMAVSTEKYHASGATITQELAIALAGVSDLLSRATEAGVDATAAASAIEMVFCTGTSHFPELAKLRGFRAMWTQLLAAYGVATEACPAPSIFVRSSQRALSALDPYTNILRLSTEAVSAILGGADTIQLASFDPAGSVSEEFTGRITRNIHHLLREESGLDRVVDPAAGSFYIDTLTATLCREAWTLFQEIEAAGGLKQAETEGMIATMISQASDANRKAINSRKRSLIGINRYAVAPTAEVANAIKAGAPVTVPEFEKLRVRALEHAGKTGSAPRAALWLHGEPAKCFRVAAFAEDFLRCGGFEVTPGVALDLETRSCRSILQDEPDIVVLCWTGEDDMKSLPAILDTMQELQKGTVVIMASKPPENAEAYLKAGLDQFIHLGSDAYASLLSLQHKTGVL